MNHFLYNSDALAVLRDCPANYVDVFVTSPPYNIGKKYEGSRPDNLPNHEYLSWCLEWLRQCQRVLRAEGSVFLNLGATSKWPTMPFEFISNVVMSSGLQLQNTFHWVKSCSVTRPDGEVISAGHFSPVNSNRIVNSCQEYVFHLSKDGKAPLDRKAVGVPYQDKSNVKRWAATGGGDLRCRGNVWFIPYDTIQSADTQRPHPATFPVALPRMCLKIASAAGKVVMDPFMGIGTTGVAARDVGAAAFAGVELGPTYFQEAKKLLEG